MKILNILILVGLLFTGCKNPEAREPISVKTGSIIDRSIELNKNLNKEQHELVQQIIHNSPDKNIIASQSGFWYYYDVIIEGDSITPKFGDIVKYTYDVKDFDDNILYTQEEIGTQNYAMDQEDLFTGLREGLKIMKSGETVTFLFPSNKAFGYYGDGNKIGSNVPLKCKVTVNNIINKEIN